MKKLSIYTILLTFISSLTIAAEVNIFNARHYKADAELYSKFTNKTGIKVNLINGKAGALEKRMIEEGADSSADLYITADAGRCAVCVLPMTGSAPGLHDGTRFQQCSRARTSVQLLLTVTALCWSASNARRTALSKHVSAAAVRRASLADQHSAVTVRSSWRLLYGIY